MHDRAKLEPLKPIETQYVTGKMAVTLPPPPPPTPPLDMTEVAGGISAVDLEPILPPSPKPPKVGKLKPKYGKITGPVP